jgi:hypothetical protein
MLQSLSGAADAGGQRHGGLPAYLEKLDDRDLQKLSRHGGVQPQPQTEPPVAAIKLST